MVNFKSAPTLILILTIVILFIIVILWAIRVEITALQLFLMLAVPVVATIIYVLLFWKNRKVTDELLDAKAYAFKTIRDKHGFQYSEIRCQDTGRAFEGEQFYSFVAEKIGKRQGLRSNIIVKKIANGFNLYFFRENATEEDYANPFHMIETVYPGSPVKTSTMMPYPEFLKQHSKEGQNITFNVGGEKKEKVEEE